VSSRYLIIVASAVALSACGSSPAPAPMGSVKMKFQVGNSAKMDSALKSPLMGNVYGNVFLQEDVSVTGPRNDAMGFADVTVNGVDLRTKDLSDQEYSVSLAPGTYVFLGFYDVNGDGATSKSPDTGDPVTLPTTNDFTVTDRVTTDRVIEFDLVYN
jgi:hypothetical protein